jgi:hypothetical protein
MLFSFLGTVPINIKINDTWNAEGSAQVETAVLGRRMGGMAEASRIWEASGR